MLNKRVLFLCALLAPLVGCQKEVEIRHYEIPLPEGRTRLLGAIMPQENKVWLFKMMGTQQRILEQKDNFDKFIRSVRFQGETPTWTVPEGWRPEAGKEQRFAAFRIGPKDQELELTVMPREAKASARIDVVNFWRQQLGLDIINSGASAQLHLIGEKVSLADDGLAFVIDMTSPASPAKAGKMHDLDRPRPVELTYTVPDKWQKLPLTGERKAAFRVVYDDQIADITVFALGGNVVDNINRWRQEVGLAVLSGEQMEKEVTLIKVAAESAAYVDLLKPGGGPLSKRVLGVILPRGPGSWFFKMTGPSELVGQQKAIFEAFVRSVQFP